MFTIAIFEYLLKGKGIDKPHKINKFKDLVCSNSFLDFGKYTKGLLLKGLSAMIEDNMCE